MSLSITTANDFLNEYTFKDIWNSVRQEYNVNIQLNVFNSRLQTNVINIGNTAVGLPTVSTLYTVYYFDFSLLDGSTNLLYDKWISSVELINTQQVLWTFINSAGVKVPWSEVWVLLPSGTTTVFVAVSKQGMIKTISLDTTAALYLTVMKNPSLTNKMTLNYLTIPSTYTSMQNNIRALLESYKVNPTKSSLFQNGYRYDFNLNNIPTFSVGDFLEVFTDNNIYASYEITVDDNTTGYQSTLYSSYREIIHCPKNLNPNNYLLTQDSMIFYVRDLVSEKCVFLPRLENNAVVQITHNDVSIDRAILDSLKASLNTSAISVIAHTRLSPSPIVLQSDASYIDYLYTLNDSTIVSFLQGSNDSSLPFWTANSLEQSSYISLMYNNQDTNDETQLSMYVNALGYYKVASLLSQNVYTTTYEGGDLIVYQPLSSYANTMIPLLFVNGLKINQQTLTYTNYSLNMINISETKGVYIPIGAKIGIKLYDSYSGTPTRFTPSLATPSITLTDNNYTVYKISELTTPQVGYNHQSTEGFLEVSPSSTTFQIYVDPNGGYDYTFPSSTFGTSFLFVPNVYMIYFNFNIDYLLNEYRPLIFPIQVADTTGKSVPIISSDSIDVFINGHQLVNGIDFIFSPLVDAGNVTYLSDMIICNRNFLNLQKSGNVLEIYFHNDQTLSVDIGYVVNNVLTDGSRPDVWQPYVGNAIIEGLQHFDLVNYGIYKRSTGIPNGSLFQTSVTYSQAILDFLNTYSFSTTVEFQRLSAIDTYLKSTVPPFPPTISITQEHQLYSPYITAIVYDIINNKLIVANDPNDSGFLNQFSSYSYLQTRDPTLSNNNDIDRRFISIGASYTSLPTTSPTNFALIQRLISLVLDPSTSTIGETPI